jgi:hypothetical protein
MELSVQKKFDSYPINIKPTLFAVRDIIILVASEHNIVNIEETLK